MKVRKIAEMLIEIDIFLEEAADTDFLDKDVYEDWELAIAEASNKLSDYKDLKKEVKKLRSENESLHEQVEYLHGQVDDLLETIDDHDHDYDDEDRY